MSILNKNELNKISESNMELNLDQFKDCIYKIASGGYTSVTIKYEECDDADAIIGDKPGNVYIRETNTIVILINTVVATKAKLTIHRTIDKICKEENIYFKDNIIDWAKDYYD